MQGAATIHLSRDRERIEPMAKDEKPWEKEGLHSLEAKSSARPGVPKEPVRVRIGVIFLINCCPVCGGQIVVRKGKAVDGVEAKIAFCGVKKCPWRGEVVET